MLRHFCRFVLVLSALLSGTANAQTADIDTYTAWNSTTGIGDFGGGTTQTYGQTFTVTSDSVLSSFSFYMGCTTGDTFHTRIYAWDGTKITGDALFSASAQTAPSDASSPPAFLEYSYAPQIRLAPGDYVFFATTSLNSSTTAGDCKWGFRNSDVYSGGFVYLNHADGLDFSELSSTAWNDISGNDLAFKMSFQAPPPATPVPVLPLFGLLSLGGLLALLGLRKIKA